MSRVRTLVATEFLMLLGLLAYVGLAYLVEQALSLSSPIPLAPMTALVMACLPAGLWLVYFYAQERQEPQPKAFVAGMFLLGALVAAPIAHFVVDLALSRSGQTASVGVFAAERWIAAIGIVGLTQEICKYAVVRYTMYSSPALSEPLDGILYATATGIGFAAHDSYRFFQSQGAEVLLGAGAAHSVITTLAHMSFAGIVGYALGRAKFSASGPLQRSLTLCLGLVAAAIVNGCFYMVVEGLASSGLETSPWRRILASFGFSALLLLVTIVLIRRLLSLSPSRAENAVSGVDVDGADVDGVDVDGADVDGVDVDGADEDAAAPEATR